MGRFCATQRIKGMIRKSGYRFFRKDHAQQREAASIMSRRTKRPLAKRASGDRPKGARPYRGSRAERPHGHRPGGKPARFLGSTPRDPKPFPPEPVKDVAEPAPLPTKVQTVVVTAD